jgi:hypothetical protein
LTNIYSHGVGDCGIKVKDADGICWLVSNNFGCQTVYGSCNATPVICDRVSSDMYDAASGKKYDDYTYIFSDDMTLYVDTHDELKKVENFLFRFIYPEEFSLHIVIRDEEEIGEYYRYRTVYNEFAQGLVLETF